MSNSSSFVADPTGFVADEAFAFDQLPPAPPAPRQVDIAEARGEAEQLLESARAEAQMIRDAAREEGFQQGLQMGRDEAAAQTAPAAQALATALAEIAAERERVADEIEAAAVDLAIEIAQKAIAGAMDVDPTRVVDVVRGALRCLVERERVTILVHPEDLPLVREQVDSLVRQLGGIEHCEVQEERRVPRGGAMVRSQTGEIDARISTKLERAREIFVAELQQ
jgi:flagellar biosynthesis/type III secretory pathway protein FliH